MRVYVADRKGRDMQRVTLDRARDLEIVRLRLDAEVHLFPPLRPEG